MSGEKSKSSSRISRRWTPSASARRTRAGIDGPLGGEKDQAGVVDRADAAQLRHHLTAAVGAVDDVDDVHPVELAQHACHRKPPGCAVIIEPFATNYFTSVANPMALVLQR